uniref:Uncharacterized protein n=1 Tax=Arundo donax TaxID=35708 RepID=A0A0A9BJN1_ARUDO
MVRMDINCISCLGLYTLHLHNPRILTVNFDARMPK